MVERTSNDIKKMVKGAQLVPARPGEGIKCFAPMYNESGARDDIALELPYRVLVDENDEPILTTVTEDNDYG